MQNTPHAHHQLAHQVLRFAGSAPLSAPARIEEADPTVAPPAKRRRPAKRRPFTTAQVGAALALLSHQSAQDLKSADFGLFKRKLSWQELAKGVIESLAQSLLELVDIDGAADRARLLWHRLDCRRSAGVRTTCETQDAIELLRHSSDCVSGLASLRRGSGVTSDVEACTQTIRCASVAVGLWNRLSSLVPHVTPRTCAFHRLIRDALAAVRTHPAASKADKRHALALLGAARPVSSRERHG